MAEQFVQVSPDSTGKKVRTEEVTVSAQTVEQQVISQAASDGSLVESTVSTLNASTTPLTVGATFTGTFEDVKNYGAITVSVYTDAPSNLNGFTFDWSNDGTTLDLQSTSSVSASSGRGFNISPRARYFRVTYTNGLIAQAIFRLGVVYHVSGSGLITKPLKDTLDTNNFAQQVRAIVDGYDGTNFQHISSALTRLGNGTALVTQSVNAGDELGHVVEPSTNELLSLILDRVDRIAKGIDSIATFSGPWSLQDENDHINTRDLFSAGKELE